MIYCNDHAETQRNYRIRIFLGIKRNGKHGDCSGQRESRHTVPSMRDMQSGLLSLNFPESSRQSPLRKRNKKINVEGKEPENLQI